VAIKIALASLGCKLNQAEMESMARRLLAAGYQLSSEAPDIYILNTCTVTAQADSKSRNLLRRARRRYPAAMLVATGCYAEQALEVLTEIIGGSGWVVPNRAKPEIPEMLAEIALPNDGVGSGSSPVLERTRTLVKIQDGCNSFCNYCIVPLVRGREASRPVDEIVAEVASRVAGGYREVVLTGVKIGAYREADTGLVGLVRRILRETEVARLRLSSLQPLEITPELMAIFADGRLCPQLHLCLQSGSDPVLRGMGRGYTTADYAAAVEMVRRAAPEVAITTDVMVGFPGESDADFEASYEFCKKLELARIHVFSYSRRAGTAAADYPGQVAEGIKRGRSQRLLDLAAASADRFQRRFAGQISPVLFERRVGGIWSGLSPNYIKVYARSARDLTNAIVNVRLGDGYRDGRWGELV